MSDNLFPITYGAGGQSDLDDLSVRLRDQNGTSFGLKHMGNKLKVVSVPWMHQLIHDGLLFQSGYYWESVANSGTAQMTWHSGTVMPQFLFEVSVSGASIIRIVEGGTITGGTALATANLLRAATNTLSGSATHSGTLTGGTAFPYEFIPGGQKNFAGGGGARKSHEVIGYQNTSYTIQIVNKSGEASVVSATFIVYEEDEP